MEEGGEKGEGWLVEGKEIVEVMFRPGDGRTMVKKK